MARGPDQQPKASKKEKAPKKPSRKTVSPREAIVSMALEIFLKQGVAGTRMLEIAKKAKVSPSHLRYHFPTLESLTAAVIDEVLESLRSHRKESMEEVGSIRDQLVAYAGSYFDWGIRNPRHVSLWLYFYYQASFVPLFQDQNSAIREGGRARIELLILKGVESGEFQLPENVKAADLASSIQGLITGNAILCFTEKRLDPNAMKTQTQLRILDWIT